MFRTVPLSITKSSSLYTQQWYMSYRFAACTVKNSWRWAEELSETCRIYSNDKFEKLVPLVGFIIRHLIRCTVTWTSNTLSYSLLLMPAVLSYDIIRIVYLSLVQKCLQYSVSLKYYNIVVAFNSNRIPHNQLWILRIYEPDMSVSCLAYRTAVIKQL